MEIISFGSFLGSIIFSYKSYKHSMDANKYSKTSNDQMAMSNLFAKKANTLIIKSTLIDRRVIIYIKISELYSIIDSSLYHFIKIFEADDGKGVLGLYPYFNMWVNSKHLYPNTVRKYLNGDDFIYIADLTKEIIDSIVSELVWFKTIDLYFNDGEYILIANYIEQYQSVLYDLLHYHSLVIEYRNQDAKEYAIDVTNPEKQAEDIKSYIESHKSVMIKYHNETIMGLKELMEIHNDISEKQLIYKMKNDILME